MSTASLPSAEGLAHFGAPSASFNAFYFFLRFWRMTFGTHLHLTVLMGGAPSLLLSLPSKFRTSAA